MVIRVCELLALVSTMSIIQRLRCNDNVHFDETSSSLDDDNALVSMCRWRAGKYALVGGAVFATGVMWTTRSRYAEGGGFFKIYLVLPAFFCAAVSVYFVTDAVCKRQYWRRMRRYDNTNIDGDL